MMGSYIYSIVCASLFVAVILQISPDGEGGKSGKYIGFIGSLLVMLVILSPIPGFLDDADDISIPPAEKAEESDTREEISSYYARSLSTVLCEMYGLEASMINGKIYFSDEGEVVSAEITVSGQIDGGSDEAERILESIFSFPVSIKEVYDG